MQQRQRKGQAIPISSHTQACWITYRVLYKYGHVWFHGTFQNKGKILLTFDHITGEKKPYRMHSSLHNRKAMGSRLKEVLSEDEKKSHFLPDKPPGLWCHFSTWVFGYCRHSWHPHTMKHMLLSLSVSEKWVKKIRFLLIPLEPGLLHPRSHCHFGALDLR